MKPLFTIISTTFNCGDKINRTWESLVGQKFDDFEYMVVDGNSKDGTQDRLAAMKDPRIHWFSEPDKGIYDAMNKGIGRANGRFLFFLGAGDLMLPGVLQKMAPQLPATNAALVYGNVVMGADGSIYDGRFTKLKLCCRNICHQAIFYGSDVFKLVGNYDLKYRILADWAFNFKCFGEARIEKKFVPISIAMFEAGGVSSGGDRMFEADKMALIQNLLGKATCKRYKIHLWKERVMAEPKQKMKRLIPRAVLNAKRQISDQIAGR